jgi:hypothetical protein
MDHVPETMQTIRRELVSFSNGYKTTTLSSGAVIEANTPTSKLSAGGAIELPFLILYPTFTLVVQAHLSQLKFLPRLVPLYYFMPEPPLIDNSSISYYNLSHS